MFYIYDLAKQGYKEKQYNDSIIDAVLHMGFHMVKVRDRDMADSILSHLNSVAHYLQYKNDRNNLIPENIKIGYDKARCELGGIKSQIAC